MATTTFKNNMVVTGTIGALGGAKQGGTATASAGAATLNGASGKITTESLTTAQNAKYTLTLTNSSIAAADGLFVTIGNGTNTQGTPVVQTATPGAGSAVIVIANKHDSAQALNGTLTVTFMVLKA
jgi:hypothetical protein